MKNYLLALMLLVFFTACNNQSTENPATDKAMQPQTEEANTNTDQEQEEKTTTQEEKAASFSRYEIDQENNDLSKSSVDAVLEALPEVKGNFALLRTFVAPTSPIEAYTDQKDLKGIRLPDVFWGKQDLVVKTLEDGHEVTVFGTGTTLKAKRENAIKGGDRFETNTNYSIDLYVKFKLSSGEMIYVGTLNEHKDDRIRKRAWHIFTLNAQQQIVSANSMFFSLYFSEGSLASTYFFASNDTPDYFEFGTKANLIEQKSATAIPAVVQKLEAAMRD